MYLTENLLSGGLSRGYISRYHMCSASCMMCRRPHDPRMTPTATSIAAVRRSSSESLAFSRLHPIPPPPSKHVVMACFNDHVVYAYGDGVP